MIWYLFRINGCLFIFLFVNMNEIQIRFLAYVYVYNEIANAPKLFFYIAGACRQIIHIGPYKYQYYLRSTVIHVCAMGQRGAEKF